MPVYKRKKMCSECPFAANALRGYLGPMTVDDLEKSVHGPIPGIGDLGDMICHISIDQLRKKGIKTDEQTLAKGQQCVGMIRYANSVHKQARREEVLKFQKAVKETKDRPTIPPFKLREYHKG